MGLVKVGSLRLRDAEGMSVSLRDNVETFRVTPATKARPSPRLQLRSQSGRLRARLGENLYALRDVKFDIGAQKHIRRHFQRDTTRRRRRPGGPIKADDFAASDIRINLGEGLRNYVRNWDTSASTWAKAFATTCATGILTATSPWKADASSCPLFRSKRG